MENVSQVIDMDTSEFEIIIRFKLKMFDHIPPVAIKDNDNVKIFLNEIASRMEFGNRL